MENLNELPDLSRIFDLRMWEINDAVHTKRLQFRRQLVRVMFYELTKSMIVELFEEVSKFIKVNRDQLRLKKNHRRFDRWLERSYILRVIHWKQIITMENMDFMFNWIDVNENDQVGRLGFYNNVKVNIGHERFIQMKNIEKSSTSVNNNNINNNRNDSNMSSSNINSNTNNRNKDGDNREQ